jgi:hypothetical protein
MRIALTLLVTAALCSCGGSAVGKPARPGVAVPARIAPSEPLHVTFPTPWAIGDRPQGKRVIAADNYHVLFTGPGGERCDKRLHFEGGWSVRRKRAHKRTVRIPPSRDKYGLKPARSWCPGRYAGHVEFRQPDRTPPLPFPSLGRFSFLVSR